MSVASVYISKENILLQTVTAYCGFVETMEKTVKLVLEQAKILT